MAKYDYSDVEDKIFKLLVNYNRNNNYNFYFDAQYIYVNIENNLIPIKMKDFYNQIAIYNRYADIKNLYENENNLELIVFSTYINSWDINNYLLVDKKISDNLYINVKISGDNEISNDDEKVSEYINEIEKIIEECKIYASENPSKAVLLAVETNFYKTDDGRISKGYSTVYKNIVDRTYYDEIYLNHILYVSQGDYYGQLAAIPDEGLYAHEYSNENTGYSYEEQKKYMNEYFDVSWDDVEEYDEENTEEHNVGEYIEDNVEEYNDEEYIENSEEEYNDEQYIENYTGTYNNQEYILEEIIVENLSE